MFKKYLKAVKNILFPLTCFFCQKKIPRGILCLRCQTKIRFLKPPLCHSCSQPLKQNQITSCQSCLRKTPYYDRLISSVEYSDPLSSLIQLFKYQHYDYLGEFLAQLMIRQLESLNFPLKVYQAIIAVPMHSDKRKIRGYNQTEILAKFLSNHFKIPLRNDIIGVKRFRPSQTKLNHAGRLANVKEVFRVQKNLKNRNFLLVDDIFTSGATISACAKALKEKGAGKITALTLAKTLRTDSQ